MARPDQQPQINQRRYPMLDVARRLGTTHFRLFRIARDAGMLDRNNWPTRQGIDNGLFVPRAIQVHEHNRAFVRSSASVTAAGVVWLNQQLHGNAPESDLCALSRPVIGRLIASAQSLIHHTTTGTGDAPPALLEALENAVNDLRTEIDSTESAA